VHLRRALLLLALVLGLAALAASLSQPSQDSREKAQRTEPDAPTATPGTSGSGPAAIEFSQEGQPRTRRLRAGRAAVVTVDVSQAGQVELTGLGISATAEPLTPARLEVLSPRPGRHDVRFTPAGSSESRRLGTLYLIAS
jgi:glycine cleavage system aminomethyltransferase T